MTRKLPDGSTRFCYGLFTVALIVSGVAGLLVAQASGGGMESERMGLWLSATIGGNLGPLIVDIARKMLNV